MKTNDEIKELLYSLKHSYDDKDLQESLTLLEKLINANKQETSNQIFAELDKIIHGKGSTEIILRNKHVIFFGFKEYEAVKKKHKVD